MKSLKKLWAVILAVCMILSIQTAAFAAVGNGVRAQRALCAPVDWADALPGDLAFYPDLSHVGIVAGRGEDGGLLVLHCSYSLGGVVCSSDAKAAGFTDLGRPSLFEKTP